MDYEEKRKEGKRTAWSLWFRATVDVLHSGIRPLDKYGLYFCKNPPGTVAMMNRFLFGTISAAIVVLTLLSCESLGGLYLFFARGLSLEPAWVNSHSPAISDFGHLISYFILTCLGFFVFRGNFLKAVFCVAALAAVGELLQNFLPTRQASVEDLIFSFAGILLASAAVFMVRARRGV